MYLEINSKNNSKKNSDWNCTWKKIVKENSDLWVGKMPGKIREVELHKHREERVLLEFFWPLHGNTQQLQVFFPPNEPWTLLVFAWSLVSAVSGAAKKSEAQWAEWCFKGWRNSKWLDTCSFLLPMHVYICVVYMYKCICICIRIYAYVYLYAYVVCPSGCPSRCLAIRM